MRVAVIVVAIVMAATPSHASKSCMTMAEARQHFRSSHLYWHGAGHCWDATVPRYGIVHHVKPKEPEQTGQDDQESKAAAPKWREAMSEMMPDDRSSPSLAPQIIPQPSWSYDESEAPARRTNWHDRWVDVAQVSPQIVASSRADPVDALPAAGHRGNPLVTPARLLMAFLAFALLLGFIELLQSTRFDRHR